MHGLGDHGTMVGQDQHVMAMPDHHGAAGIAAPVLRFEPGPSAGLDMSTVGSCVAVLLLGVALLLAAARRGHDLLGWRLAEHPRLVHARRTHPPPRPDLFGLSIQRC